MSVRVVFMKCNGIKIVSRTIHNKRRLLGKKLFSIALQIISLEVTNKNKNVSSSGFYEMPTE